MPAECTDVPQQMVRQPLGGNCPVPVHEQPAEEPREGTGAGIRRPPNAFASYDGSHIISFRPPAMRRAVIVASPWIRSRRLSGSLPRLDGAAPRGVRTPPH